MPWLSLAAVALALLCLSTATLDWYANGFAAEWAPTGLLFALLLGFLAWIVDY